MNNFKVSLSLLSIALLLVLPNCLQTQQGSSKQGATNLIQLFIYPSCPYCQRVITSLRESGNINNVVILDATIPKYFAELKQLTNGNTQCPFIFDKEKNIKMHESQDIIKYFKQKFIA